MSAIRIKRIYDSAAAEDGVRILVDRLWPRGLKREAARIDLWLKEVAPSEQLRRWFNHDPRRWAEFQSRYRAELASNARSMQSLTELLAGKKPVTLLFAAKDAEHNNAVVLRNYLTGAASRSGPHRSR